MGTMKTALSNCPNLQKGRGDGCQTEGLFNRNPISVEIILLSENTILGIIANNH